jgi:hypothetical protein
VLSASISVIGRRTFFRIQGASLDEERGRPGDIYSKKNKYFEPILAFKGICPFI